MSDIVQLMIVNFPNLAGLVVLSAVLWVIVVRVFKALDARIAFLEARLTECLNREDRP